MIIALSRDVVVLQILFSVEGDLLSLDFTILNIDLVAYQTDWDVLANTNQVLVPLGHILISDPCTDIEHDYTAVSSDVVAIAKTSELFLSGCVPDIKQDQSL